MVYREVLVLPDGSLVRSFTSPALLQTNKVFRAEGAPIFYSESHFEITIKRSPEDMILAAGKYLPNVDKGIFQHFLRMWPVFNVHGSNCLQYVRHIILIYQLSMDMGYSFGDDIFDKRLGFRFSHDPFEEDLDGNYGEDEQSNAESDSDSIDDESDWDFEEPEAEENNLEPEDSTSNGYEYEADTDVEEDPEADFDPVGVFELNRGTFDWTSRDRTYFFLWKKVNEQGKKLCTTHMIDHARGFKHRCSGDIGPPFPSKKKKQPPPPPQKKRKQQEDHLQATQKANQYYTQSVTNSGPSTPSTDSPTCCGTASGTVHWHRRMWISCATTSSTGWQETPHSHATMRTIFSTRMMRIPGELAGPLSGPA